MPNLCGFTIKIFSSFASIASGSWWSKIKTFLSFKISLIELIIPPPISAKTTYLYGSFAISCKTSLLSCCTIDIEYFLLSLFRHLIIKEAALIPSASKWLINLIVSFLSSLLNSSAILLTSSLNN